jgi:hypothetical protein
VCFQWEESDFSQARPLSVLDPASSPAQEFWCLYVNISSQLVSHVSVDLDLDALGENIIMCNPLYVFPKK